MIINKSCLECLPPDEAIVVSDPPFNIGYHYDGYKDKMNDDEYWNMLVKVLRPPSIVIHYPEEIVKLSIKFGFAPDKMVSWVYPSNMKRQWRCIAYYGLKPDFSLGSQPYKNPKDKRIAKRIEEGHTCPLYDWWEINQVKNVSMEKTEHPCQMPLQVMRNAIKIIKSDKLIWDPFVGSGTTLLAAKLENRKYGGTEINQEYVKIAEERLKNESGII